MAARHRRQEQTRYCAVLLQVRDITTVQRNTQKAKTFFAEYDAMYEDAIQKLKDQMSRLVESTRMESSYMASYSAKVLAL
jgi:hypothetical protein